MEPGDEFDSAMIEFKSTDSVPDALAKDGKKIDGNTVSVSMLWRSTLWVTNFSPQMDDAALRTMFGNVRDFFVPTHHSMARFSTRAGRAENTQTTGGSAISQWSRPRRHRTHWHCTSLNPTMRRSP